MNKIIAVFSKLQIKFNEKLVEKTNMDIPRISDILLRLQMKKLVQQLPGKQFVRA